MQPRHVPYEICPETSRFSFYENHWKRVGLSLLQEHCPARGQTVLDYGCGRGETVQIFGAAGFKVTGADIDPECVRLAGRFGPAVLLQVEGPVAQLGPKSFDLVTCFHVLEHVENPKRTLQELVGVAREYVLLGVPNLRCLNRMFERKFDLSQVNEGHLQAWDHWHLRNLAERFCGLELVAWGSDATILPGISALSERLFGREFAIRLETGLFRKLFPYHCISVLGLFRVKPVSRG
jgi:SAM-dependent methyltransferase